MDINALNYFDRQERRFLVFWNIFKLKLVLGRKVMDAEKGYPIPVKDSQNPVDLDTSVMTFATPVYIHIMGILNMKKLDFMLKRVNGIRSM